ncbi:MAG: hypothetical protein LQ338_008057 [Usnochroma carphineum]|nr:MAG: hypothetical protein LQ338_008057 [Usnochroma carphineum]
MANKSRLQFTAVASISISPRARRSYIAFFNICRTLTTTCTRCSSSQFHRSDFANQPFTGTYEPGGKTSGPLGDSPILGAPTLTPKVLKQHLDQFVVGQERAKKVLSVAVYNHYQRIQEAQRLEEEEEELSQQRLRREGMHGHPLQDEYPGQQHAIPLHAPASSLGSPPLVDSSPLTLEKANVLLLGPSGVGKTLMAKTLARVLAVPFSMSDCTPFTQAGYIGEDAEICVQRLLAAANYDVAAAERGIICLDEIDKISTAKMSHGKDVGGEGVQQALLKIIEGTTLQVQAKHEKSSSNRSPSWAASNYPTNSPLAGGNMPPTPTPGSGSTSSSPSSKAETYNVRTDNILFIFAGAFVGLQKLILNRTSKSSIGFGAPIRSSSIPHSSSSSSSSLSFHHNNDYTIPLNPNSPEFAELSKHIPYYTPPPSSPSPSQNQGEELTHHLNPLELVQPTDLQSYGLIPELIGRIPITAALSALSLPLLIRVLTEPRNSIIKQYTQLFALSGIELAFTQPALREIAKSALGMGTGARGLRTCVESLLTETMFEVPGSSVKSVAVTGAVARKECAPIYFGRGQGGRFRECVEGEDVEEEGEEGKRRASDAGDGGEMGSFEEYREKSRAAGVI